MITVGQLKKIKEKNQDVVNFRKEGAQKGKGKYRSHVLVCAGTGCTSSGSQKIADKLEEEIKAVGLEEEVCVVRTGCHGLCALGPGFNSKVSAAPFQDLWINNMECEFCGNCIQACPVGALRPKNRDQYRPWETKRVESTCYNCKKGCKRVLLIKDNKIVDVVADPESENNGRLCNKGRFEFYDVERPEQIAILEAKDIENAREVLKAQLEVE